MRRTHNLSKKETRTALMGRLAALNQIRNTLTAAIKDTVKQMQAVGMDITIKEGQGDEGAKSA